VRRPALAAAALSSAGLALSALLHGLGHCPDPLCVMSFSNTIRDVDRKNARLCPRCKSRLALLLGGRR
jgi:hypothetical protein